MANTGFFDELVSMLSMSDQDADVTNVGYSNADTGHNTAVGNNSTNTATSDQDADAEGGLGLFGGSDDVTAANQATNKNASDGTAVIRTGDAQAVGNVADTTIAQDSDGGWFGFGDQDADVTNIGYANANTGGNTAIGNNSTNTATSDQDADADGGFGFGSGSDDVTAANQASNTNVSDGTAIIVTGDAQAVGNVADTTISQDADGSGFGFGDQDADVTNIGYADANTGGNTAIGNNSTNTATSDQDADADGGFGFDGSDDVTAANQASNTNVSDGTAGIHTGDASAVGNVADTDIDQDTDGFDLDDLDIDL